MNIVLTDLIIIISGSILILRLLWTALQTIVLYRQPHDVQKDSQSRVSVIICARNEASNLRNHLPSICEQKYAQFEVIVVNDASTDNTERVLIDMEEKYSNLRHTVIHPDPKFGHGKKLAMSIGIKSSKYDHLVLIDADCVPASDLWLDGMVKKLLQKDIVLGYGAYKTNKGLLNRIIRFDTFQIAANYMTAAQLGLPYMGVGRNLAYKKEIYTKSSGFKKHYHIESGDDDLLINQMARRKNTIINLDSSCFTYSEPKKTFRKWILQKKRHLEAGGAYRFLHKIFLTFIWGLTTLTLPLLVLINLLSTEFCIHIIIFTISYLFLLMILWKFIMVKFKEKSFLLLIPFLELSTNVLPVILVTINWIKKRPSKWN